MGYRLPAERKGFRPCHVNHLDDTASHTILTIDNGTISYISIPCFYEEYHDRVMHDHVGWPSPDHPDKSCQLPSGCEHIAVPIDLKNEGYKTVEVSMIDPPEGLVISGTIDYGMVNLRIEAMCDSLTTNDADISICIYAVGDFGSYADEGPLIVRDVVLKGNLHIVAGPIR